MQDLARLHLPGTSSEGSSTKDSSVELLIRKNWTFGEEKISAVISGAPPSSEEVARRSSCSDTMLEREAAPVGPGRGK